MSQENIDVVRRLNAAFNSGNLDAFADSWDDAIEFRDQAHAPDSAETVRGKGALRSIWAQWSEAFDELRADVSEYVDRGDYVLCVTRWVGTGRASDLAVDVTQVDVYEVRDGKILRATLAYPDMPTALEAVARAGVRAEDNLELCRRFAQAISENDVEGMLAVTAEDVVLITLRSVLEGGFRGHAGVRAFAADNEASFDVFSYTVNELRELDDGRVLGFGTVHFRGRGGGVETEAVSAGIATFADAKLTRWEDFGDRTAALEAAGLRE